MTRIELSVNKNNKPSHWRYLMYKVSVLEKQKVVSHITLDQRRCVCTTSGKIPQQLKPWHAGGKKKRTVPYIPHVVVFFEESIVLHCPLLELHVYTAAIDADDAPDPTGRGRGMETDKQFREILLLNLEIILISGILPKNEKLPINETQMRTLTFTVLQLYLVLWVTEVCLTPHYQWCVCSVSW